MSIGNRLGGREAGDQVRECLRVEDRPVVLPAQVRPLRQGLLELPELQGLEQRRQGLGVGRLDLERLQVRRHRCIRVDGHQSAAQKRLIFVLQQLLLLLLAGDGIDAGIQVLEAAEVPDEFEGRLGADARHPRDVVRGVAGQAHHIHHLRRIDTHLLFDGGKVGARLLHRVPDARPFGDQLHEVLVAGHHHDRKTFLLQTPRQRADEVVGLVAGHLENRQAVAGRDLLDVGDLERHVRGHRGAVRLVEGEDAVAEGRAAGIEKHGRVLGGALRHELDQHAGEPENGVGRQPPGVGEALNRVICAMDVGGAVDEIDRTLWLHASTTLGGIFAGRGPDTGKAG